ncbi:MAG: ABC transporter permease [Elusimicrobia bacterium]|nr:ABC transporter permease [Elusimicrobiota bacterium]
MNHFFLAAGTLWQRELVRFYRDRSRVIGALVPPLVFWFLIGSGLGSSFKATGSPGDMNYLQYFFPGTIVLIVLFTAIFSTISIIEDRHEGFLQSVLVAPISRASLVTGKLLGGSTLAFLQGLVFLLIAPGIGLTLPLPELSYVLMILFLIAFGLTGLGFCIAWSLDSTQGFHAIMNLFLIPMWMLSGALFPVNGAPAWLRLLVHLNPLTYGIAALQQSFLIHGLPPLYLGPSPLLCATVITLFGLLTFGISLFTASRSKSS